MANPLLNGWFVLGIALTILSITIKVIADKQKCKEFFWIGVGTANIMLITALVCLIVGSVEIIS